MSWPHKVVNHCASTLRALVLHRHAVRIVVLGHQKSGTTAIAALLSMMLDDKYSNDPIRDARTVIRGIADRLSLSKEDLCVTAENLSLPNRHWRLILSGALPPERGATVV